MADSSPCSRGSTWLPTLERRSSTWFHCRGKTVEYLWIATWADCSEAPIYKPLEGCKRKTAQTEEGLPKPKSLAVFFYKKGNYAPVPTAVNNIRNSSGRPLYRMKSLTTKISYVLYPEGNSINTVMLCNYTMPLSWAAQNVLQRWGRSTLLKNL